jgi:hypothetical protein
MLFGQGLARPQHAALGPKRAIFIRAMFMKKAVSVPIDQFRHDSSPYLGLSVCLLYPMTHIASPVLILP